MPIGFCVRSSPTRIGGPTVPVAVSIRRTELPGNMVTYTALPSGVAAIWYGEPLPSPTGIGVPAVFVAVSMGVTVPSPQLVTHANTGRGTTAAVGSAVALAPPARADVTANPTATAIADRIR